MRHAANFHPEWGYLAPAPGFIRTARIVLVATAVGAIVGAGVGFSRASRQPTEPSVAARTLVRPIEAIPAGAKTAAQATQANTPSSTEKQSLTVNSRSVDGPVNERSTSSTIRVAGSSVIAEAPAATDGPAIATTAAAPTASKKPVLNIAPFKKKATKKSNATWRFALRDEAGEYYARRSWGGYYGDGGRYQNWW